MKSTNRFHALTSLFAVVVLGCGSNNGASSLSSGNGGATSLSGSGGADTRTSGGASSETGGDTGLFSAPPTSGNACSNGDISVLFLIDRSGSMNCNLPPLTASADCEKMSPPAKVDTAQPSKWEVMSQTLSTALGELAQGDASVKVRAGVSFFSIDGVCGARSSPAVPVDATTPEHLDAIRKAVSTQVPSGGTPIVGAAVLGYKYLYQELGVTGNAHVILITDGQDSCGAYYAANTSIGSGDQVTKLIASEAPSALGVGIKTWVVGAPGSEVARSTLSNLAVAGGTRRTPDCTPGTAADPTVGDCHYDMTTGDFGSALKTALDHIVRVVTCQSIQ